MMPRKSTAPEGKRQRRRRGSCFGLSCFGASSVADSDDPHLVERGSRAPSWFTWSRFRKKKKTVPLDASAEGGIPMSAAAHHGEDPPPEDEEARKQYQLRSGTPPASTTAPPPAISSAPRSFFWRLWKTALAMDVTRSKVCAAAYHERRPAEAQPRLRTVTSRSPASRPGPDAAAPCCPPSAPSAVASPSRPTNPRDSACRTETRPGGTRVHKIKSEPEPPTPRHPEAEHGHVLGLSVMAVVLAMLLLFGRVGAVLLTCLWFYCLPRLRAAVMDGTGGGGDKSRINVVSEEYKKKVVLEGLLQRNGRRMPYTLA